MKNKFTLLCACTLVLIGFNPFNQVKAQIGTWSLVKKLAPHENLGTMLLMTDGTVMCHNATGSNYGTGWDKLTPSSTGSYANGTWTTTASMRHDRFFFASQVLPSGELFVAGGEYGSGDTAAEVYDPVANTWKSVGGIGKTYNIYDGNSEILPNGNVLIGVQLGPNPSYDNLYYAPGTNECTIAPICASPYNHDEAAWLKLPDSSILFVGIGSISSCRFEPKTSTWIADAALPDSIYDVYTYESGSAVLLPNGKAIFFGATGHNLIYTPSGTTAPGSWVRVADFPFIGGVETGMIDAPSAMMVNGNILCAVSPISTSIHNTFLDPIYFVEYNYLTNAFTQVTSNIPGLGTDEFAKSSSSFASMLDLPDGTVLVAVNQQAVADSNERYYIYTPGSAAIPQGKPTINNIFLQSSNTYKITGKLFNGISEGAQYGDDEQESSNYPLVRLTNSAGNVYYAKTTNWNRIGAVQTDSLEDTAFFTTPSTLPSGTYSLVVVANGFASNPTIFSNCTNSYTEPICIVTIDTANNKSEVIWGRTNSPPQGGSGSYKIYKDSTGGYALTHSQALNVLSEYIDLLSDPSAGPTSYKLSTVDSCGESALSAPNTTIYLTTTAGTNVYILNWTAYIGFTPSKYRIFRGPALNKMIQIDSVSSSVLTFHDTLPPTGVYYAVEAVNPSGSCVATPHTPTRIPTTSLSGSFSNGFNTGLITTGVKNIGTVLTNLNTYPDPSNGIFTLSYYLTGTANVRITLVNELGQVVYDKTESRNPGGVTEQLNLESLSSGVYSLRMQTEYNIMVRKLVIMGNK